MTPHTKQSLFNVSYTGLHAQGFERSMDEAGMQCMYRGKAMRKCGIGHAIPDSEYKKSYEGKGIGGCSLEGLRIKIGIGSDGDLIDFAGQLQRAHDHGGSPEIMQRNLAELAKRHGLKVPPC